MVLRVGPLGRQLGYKGRILMNGINALISVQNKKMSKKLAGNGPSPELC